MKRKGHFSVWARPYLPTIANQKLKARVTERERKRKRERECVKG